MQIPKSSEHDRDWFRSLIPTEPSVEIKPMFGNLGAFVNGNMFAGLFGQTIGVKLDTTDRAELSAIEGTGAFGPAERPMPGYVRLPDSWRTTPRRAAEWIDKSLRYVESLPPKGKKTRR
jgi:TfoX/Sxy family transcriptional regulator of competence genes